MSRKRWFIVGGLALAAIVLSSVAWTLRDDLAYAKLATGYAAKQTCSCLHVSGRTLDSCLAEFPDDARAMLSITEDANTVRASVLFGAISAEAVYEEEYGCSLAD
ncbi:MAG: hypothetical protein DCF16_03530 [Alphaproteobacteria bacterium]|nr:MAG: hypothetical protein DCF16_03530 [Alphaproteobacteria bacterium]